MHLSLPLPSRGVHTRLRRLSLLRHPLLMLLFMIPAALPFPVPVNAATDADSLKAQLVHATPDSNRVLLLNRLAQKLAREDPREALEYVSEALELAHTLHWGRGIIEATNTRGALYTNEGRFEEAIEVFHTCLTLSDSIGALSLQARALRNLGVVYRRIGNTPKALEYTTQSLEMTLAIGDSVSWAVSRVNIGNIHNTIGNHDEALAAFTGCEGVFQRRNDLFGVSTVLNGMGEAYSALGQHARALEYFRRSLAINESLGDQRSIAVLRGNVAEVREKQGQVQEAIREHLLALEIAQRIQAIDLIDLTGKRLSRLYAGLGDYRKAYDYFVIHASVRDSLLTQKSLHDINTLAERHEEALLEQERALQRAELDRQALIRNIIIAGLVIAVLIAGLLFHLARQRKIANEQLRVVLADLQRAQEQLIHAEKMASFGRLSAGFAHEILNPLNFIINFTDLSRPISDALLDANTRANVTEEDLQTLQSNLNKISEYSLRTERIVRSIVHHADGGTGEFEMTDISTLLRQSLDLAAGAMQTELPELDIHLETQIGDQLPAIPVIPREITRVLVNLYRNAAESLSHKSGEVGERFTPTIAVRAEGTADAVVIRMRDNGRGIPADTRSRIFEAFFTTKDAGTGTGLGLSISYDIIVEGHGGSLTVESRAGEGAEFAIRLPVSRTRASSAT